MLALTLLPELSTVVSILTVALGLGLVIFFHELGHFAVAKWCNVHVERFSIGFGPILLSRKWGETEYALSAIPFGGYVKMLGQDDVDPSQLTSDEIAQDPRSYTAKTVPQRMAIISAGVTMNVVTGLMFFVIAFRCGIERPAREVGNVQVGMPAWEQGILPGDIIKEINGRRVDDFLDVMRGVALSSGTVTVAGVHADGTKYTATIDPQGPDGKEQTRRQIGVGFPRSLMISPQTPQPGGPAAVPGFPAATVSPAFQANDVIRRVGDSEISSYAELDRLLLEKRAESLDFFVSREGENDLIRIAVPPQRYRTLGLQMDIGKIAAVRAGSPAEQAGLRVGDKIVSVAGEEVGDDLVPLQLPEVFAESRGAPVEVEISREVAGSEPVKKRLTVTPDPNANWRELPLGPHAPVSITAIGAAFHLIPTVHSITPDGPAAKAGIQNRDQVTKVEFILREDTPYKAKYREADLNIDIGEDNWAFASWLLQKYPVAKVRLTVKSSNSALKSPIELVPVEVTNWYAPSDRGLDFQTQSVVLKGENIGESMSMGWRNTVNAIFDIYLTLRGLATGDVSVKELHGPIGIADFAYQSAKSGLPDFILFLGIISVNLAVINFLPIPVLDGGHMVFLIWEAVIRRKPSEKIVIAATYCGFAVVVTLMILVFWLDLFVHRN